MPTSGSVGPSARVADLGRRQVRQRRTHGVDEPGGESPNVGVVRRTLSHLAGLGPRVGVRTEDGELFGAQPGSSPDLLSHRVDHGPRKEHEVAGQEYDGRARPLQGHSAGEERVRHTLDPARFESPRHEQPHRRSDVHTREAGSQVMSHDALLLSAQLLMRIEGSNSRNHSEHLTGFCATSCRLIRDCLVFATSQS